MKSSLEWATIKLLQTQKFVLICFFCFLRQCTPKQSCHSEEQIKNLFLSWRVQADADTCQHWHMPSSELMCRLRQFRFCFVRLVLACTVPQHKRYKHILPYYVGNLWFVVYSCTVIIVVTLKTLCPVGRKLIVTMTIKNVTLNDDSTYGLLGRYECHTFAEGDPKVRRHGFSVHVILSKYTDIV